MANTPTPSSANVLLGRGQVMFSRFDANGVFNEQFVSLGNCDSFAISVTPDITEMVDYTQQTSAIYASASKKTTIELKISGFEINTKNMALLVLGTASSYTQAAHTAAAQSETLVPAGVTGILGSFFRSPFRKVSATTLVQGANTLVLGTDYEIFDANAGVFHILPNGVTVVDSTAITYNYTAAAMSGGTAADLVLAATTAIIKGSLMYLPNNPAGPQSEVRVWNVALSPDGDIGLISDDFLKWSMKGTLYSDAAGAYGGSTTNPFFEVLPNR